MDQTAWTNATKQFFNAAWGLVECSYRTTTDTDKAAYDTAWAATRRWYDAVSLEQRDPTGEGMG